MHVYFYLVVTVGGVGLAESKLKSEVEDEKDAVVVVVMHGGNITSGNLTCIPGERMQPENYSNILFR